MEYSSSHTQTWQSMSVFLLMSVYVDEPSQEIRTKRTCYYISLKSRIDDSFTLSLHTAKRSLVENFGILPLKNVGRLSLPNHHITHTSMLYVYKKCQVWSSVTSWFTLRPNCVLSWPTWEFQLLWNTYFIGNLICVGVCVRVRACVKDASFVPPIEQGPFGLSYK